MTEIDLRKCRYCKYEFSILLRHCPHCARPSLFPNISLASRKEEKRELNKRYRKALEQTKKNGTLSIAIDFEKAAKSSMAVISRAIDDVYRISIGNNQLLASYYELTEGGVKLPDNDYWDRWRRVVDELFHPNFKKDIHFAALTLDGNGLQSYGDCSIVLKEKMIDHRTTAFEGNTILYTFAKANNIIKDQTLFVGHRSLWKERTKLCIAKLYHKLTGVTKPDDYNELLVEKGDTTDKDDFIELHIFGQLSIRTIHKIIVNKATSKIDMLKIEEIQKRVTEFGIDFQEP